MDGLLFLCVIENKCPFSEQHIRSIDWKCILSNNSYIFRVNVRPWTNSQKVFNLWCDSVQYFETWTALINEMCPMILGFRAKYDLRSWSLHIESNRTIRDGNKKIRITINIVHRVWWYLVTVELYRIIGNGCVCVCLSVSVSVQCLHIFSKWSPPKWKWITPHRINRI